MERGGDQDAGRDVDGGRHGRPDGERLGRPMGSVLTRKAAIGLPLRKPSPTRRKRGAAGRDEAAAAAERTDAAPPATTPPAPAPTAPVPTTANLNARRQRRAVAGLWQPATCQYLIGDARERNFCAAAVKRGSPYCPDHHALCYRDAAPAADPEEIG